MDATFGTQTPAGPWDVIVVGSGMGGLTTAALLGKLGRRVLVLEQHYVPGGFTHAFRRHGWHWDVGVHAVGEVTEHTATGRLLSRLTDGRLQWASLGPVYDRFEWHDGFAIDFPDSPRQFRDNLLHAFPNEPAAIDRWFSLARQAAGAMKGFFAARLLPERAGRLAERIVARPARALLATTAGEVLRELTPDARLRSVLSAQWGYHGALPDQASFAVQALVTRHFLHGAYYPVGGSGRIAAELLRTVADAGGYARIRADVARIVLEGGRAVGVALADGEELRAPVVISAIGVRATVTRLLPPEESLRPWARRLAALPAGPAHVCLYLGLKGDPRAAGATAANRWFWETWRADGEAFWDVHPDRAIPRAPVLYTSFPSLKDPTHDPGPAQLHTAEVVTFVPWESFAPWQRERWHHRGEAYEAFKARLTAQLLAQLYERMPGLRPLVQHAELGTPVSTEHFVRPVRGSIYGLLPTPRRFAEAALRPRSPIPGLFFSGSEVGTVGVIGAMVGGALAGVAAEPREALPLLRRALRG